MFVFKRLCALSSRVGAGAGGLVAHVVATGCGAAGVDSVSVLDAECWRCGHLPAGEAHL